MMTIIFMDLTAFYKKDAVTGASPALACVGQLSFALRSMSLRDGQI